MVDILVGQKFQSNGQSVHCLEAELEVILFLTKDGRD